MSYRRDSGQSDSIRAPVLSHIISNVESFTYWFANTQPSCIPEIPLQYRLLSPWVVLEIQNILFCFINMQPPVWNFEVQSCCFLAICVCVYLQFMKLPSWLQQPLAFPTNTPHPSRAEGRTASVRNTLVCLASLRKPRKLCLTGWAKGPEMQILGRSLSNLMTSKLHF